MSPPTIVPNSPSVQPANHRPVSIAMSQRSGVIKFLAAKRMKEDREGGKSRVGERGGGAGNMRNEMPVNTKAEWGFGVGDSSLGSTDDWCVPRKGGCSLQGQRWRPVVRPDCCLAGRRPHVMHPVEGDLRHFLFPFSSPRTSISHFSPPSWRFSLGSCELVKQHTSWRISWRQTSRLCYCRQGCFKGMKTLIVCFSAAPYCTVVPCWKLTSDRVGNVSTDLFKRLLRAYFYCRRSSVGRSGAQDTSRS